MPSSDKELTTTLARYPVGYEIYFFFVTLPHSFKRLYGLGHLLAVSSERYF